MSACGSSPPKFARYTKRASGSISEDHTHLPPMASRPTRKPPIPANSSMKRNDADGGGEGDGDDEVEREENDDAWDADGDDRDDGPNDGGGEDENDARMARALGWAFC
mmetsp:Transcript_4978/g.11969  ORF Transcript_4978/g.11969 Transcript_4978/m.11969 type:complete len:108 (+) Transcript_4978:1429-1752(+)